MAWVSRCIQRIKVAAGLLEGQGEQQNTGRFDPIVIGEAKVVETRIMCREGLSDGL